MIPGTRLSLWALLTYHYHSFPVYSLFRLNMYTSPAYFMALVCAATLCCLVLYFADRHFIETEKSDKNLSARRFAIQEVAESKTMCGMMSIYDACICGCMLLNVATKGSIACFETLGIEYAETHFNMASQHAGMLVATCGTFGVLALLAMGSLEAHFSDVQLICGGMIVMGGGIMSLVGVEAGQENSHWRYFFSMFFIYAIGYPIGHTAVIGLFSKSKFNILSYSTSISHVSSEPNVLLAVVGRRPQGLLLGWFASAGSLARMIFPIMAGYIANFTDVVVLFIILTLVLSLSTAFVLISRSTLNTLSS